MTIKCGVQEHETSYNSRYDCYCCTVCDTWLESQCDDPTCEICRGRPSKPSMIKEIYDDSD